MTNVLFYATFYHNVMDKFKESILILSGLWLLETESLNRMVHLMRVYIQIADIQISQQTCRAVTLIIWLTIVAHKGTSELKELV